MSSPNFTFQYKPRSDEDWERVRNQQGGTFVNITKDQFKNYGPKKGQNWIRILPPTWEGARHYALEIYQHGWIGPSKATLLCLNRMQNKACPICEHWQELEKLDREDAGNFRPVKRMLIWLLDRKQEDAGPQLWPVPWKNDRDLSNICKDPENGAVYNIDNPQGGFDVIFNKEGELTNTTYTGWQLSRRATDVDMKFVEFAVKNPLPTTLLYRGYQEMKEILMGGAAEPDTKHAPAAQVSVPPGFNEPAVDATPRPAPGQEYCLLIAKFRGETLACGLPKGHTGDHDYVIGVNETPEPAATVHQPCEKTFTTKGMKYGCGFTVNHAGECDFSRELGAVAPPVTVQQTASVAVQPSVQAAAAPVTTAAVPTRPLSERAEALKNRFPQR